MGRPDYICGQFRETARCHDAQHGDGVCCALAPQLVTARKQSESANLRQSPTNQQTLMITIMITPVYARRILSNRPSSLFSNLD